MSDFLPVPPTYAIVDPQARAVLDALARNVQVTIDSIQASAAATTTVTDLGGGTTFGSASSTTNVTNLGAAYTPQNLKDDLATGTANVIAGAINGTTIMKLSPTGSYVVFQHKDAIILGNTGAYTGDVRTALGITSTGIVGGYNDKTTGAWQSTFTIESATGNLTVLGTIKANSVIQVGAYLGTTLVSTVLADIGTKLSASSSYVLTGAVNVQNTGGIQAGNVTWNATTGVVTGGTGVVMTENGITGVKAGVVTFSIDGSGNAVFAGDISTSGDAYFAGSAQTTTNLAAFSNKADYTMFASATTNALSSAYVRVAVLGQAAATTSYADVGVYGEALSTTKGTGVVGAGGYVGGYFFGASASSIALWADPFNSSTTALSVWGPMEMLNNARVVNLNADLLDGYHASSFFNYVSTTSGASTATFSNTNKPGSGSTNVWMQVSINGSTYYVPVWT